MFVMVDDDPPGSNEEADSALAVARERVRGLEAQVELLQGHVKGGGKVDHLDGLTA